MCAGTHGEEKADAIPHAHQSRTSRGRPSDLFDALVYRAYDVYIFMKIQDNVTQVEDEDEPPAKRHTSRTFFFSNMFFYKVVSWNILPLNAKFLTLHVFVIRNFISFFMKV